MHEFLLPPLLLLLLPPPLLLLMMMWRRWAVTRVLLGWRELHPTVSAAAIAASTAAALRAPMVS
jgi:hypothetical protein